MSCYIATYNSIYQEKLKLALMDLEHHFMSSEQELINMLLQDNIDETILPFSCNSVILFIDYELYIKLDISKKIHIKDSTVVTIVLLCENIEEVNTEFLYASKTIILCPLERFSVKEIHILSQLQLHNMKNMEKLQYAACLDSLTKVRNRRSFMHIVEQNYQMYKKIGAEFCLAYLDLDHFKVVNDTFGHIKGDELLEKIAKIMVQSCRKTDVVGRIGGEEFGILFPETTLKHALEVLQRIRHVIAETSEIEDIIRVTLSAGVVTSNNSHTSYIDVIKDADLLLYKAKDWGRDQICQ